MSADSVPSEDFQQDTDSLGRRVSRLAHSLNRPSRLTLLSYALCAPLLLFLGVFFLFPLLYVLHTGLHNPVIGSAWPEFIQALRDDHEYLLRGDVFTEDVIDTWVWYKTEKEIDAIRERPHPFEFAMYYDI
jgi:ABC-type sugar transport system permease subunit